MSFITILAGTSRRSDHRRRDVRVPAAMIEMLEPRVVLSKAAVIAPFEVVSATDQGPQQGVNGIFATTPTQHDNKLEICSTIKNTGSTAQYVTAALFTDPDPTVNPPGTPPDVQTLITSKTVLLKPGESIEICFAVKAGECYQYDTVLGDHPPTVNGSAERGAVLKNGPYLSFSRFCVPDGTEKVKGNEGLGNGADPPPPGHAGDTVQNDDGVDSGGVVTPGKPHKGWNS